MWGLLPSPWAVGRRAAALGPGLLPVSDAAGETAPQKQCSLPEAAAGPAGGLSLESGGLKQYLLAIGSDY